MCGVLWVIVSSRPGAGSKLRKLPPRARRPTGDRPARRARARRAAAPLRMRMHLQCLRRICAFMVVGVFNAAESGRAVQPTPCCAAYVRLECLTVV